MYYKHLGIKLFRNKLFLYFVNRPIEIFLRQLCPFVQKSMASNTRYNDQDYWDERYQHELTFEWFLSYAQLAPNFKKLGLDTLKQSSVLNLGCGNSPFPVHMLQDGFKSVTNLDYSATLIDQMAQRYATDGLIWKVGDATILEEQFSSGQFGMVIEKGLLDALLVAEKSPWALSPDTRQMLEKILAGVAYVLKDGGVFVSITFAQPHFRLPLLCQARFGWSVSLEVIKSGFDYFLYHMKKGESLDMTRLERFLYPLKGSPSGGCQVLLDEDSEDFLLGMEI